MGIWLACVRIVLTANGKYKPKFLKQNENLLILMAKKSSRYQLILGTKKLTLETSVSLIVFLLSPSSVPLVLAK